MKSPSQTDSDEALAETRRSRDDGDIQGYEKADGASSFDESQDSAFL